MPENQSTRPRRQGILLEILEDRVLFDASPMGASTPQSALANVDQVAHDGQHQMNHNMAVDPSNSHIQLHSDTVPNLTQNPDNIATQSGDWSDAAVWSEGRIPNAGEIVQIADGITITYSEVSDVALEAIGIRPGAMLQFANDVDTRLVVGTMIVFEGGHLQIGSEANPIDGTVRAELIIADQPIDLERDPEQFGTGLLGFGKIEIVGEAKNRTWLRLADEPRAGDRELVLEQAVTGWHVGDTLILPDTRQVPADRVADVENGIDANFEPQWEEIRVERIEGNRVILERELLFDHRGAYDVDGQLTFLPHVGLLDRNVTIRSENPLGTRGHVLFGQRADVNVQYARFHELGRTDAFRDLDNTVIDVDGNVTHIGTNQIARYALHFHHVAGPVNETNTGYQFKIIGNTVDAAGKWGYVIHGTHYGLVQDNVAYDIQGAAFVTEDGTEIANEFVNNFAVRIQGNGDDGKAGTKEGDYGRGGDGFWARRSGNIYRNNVVANVSGAGQVFSGYYHGDVRVPGFRGDMSHMSGNGIPKTQTDPGLVENNEFYGRTRDGIWIAYPDGMHIYPDRDDFAGVSQFVVKGTRIWHVHRAGVIMWHTNGVRLEDFTILGDKDALNVSKNHVFNHRFSNGIDLRFYENDNLTIENAHIEGYLNGIVTDESNGGAQPDGQPTIIRNSYLRNQINIHVPTAYYNPSHEDAERGKALEVRNVQFAGIGVGALRGASRELDIYMRYQERYQRGIMGPDIVNVYDYNGIRGNDFRVYYYEQRPDFVPSATDDAIEFVGSPEAGLTNGQLWEKYGVAVAGAVLPCGEEGCTDALDNDRIHGVAISLSSDGPRLHVQAPHEVTVGQPVTFKFSSLDGQAIPPDQTFTFEIDWNRDGRVDRRFRGTVGSEITRPFERAGTYAVSIRILDDQGGSSAVTHELVVNPTALPRLRIDAPTQAEAGNPVRFRVFSDDDSQPEGKTFIFEFDWNGDGRIDRRERGALGMVVERPFMRARSYDVQVRMMDDAGQVATANHRIDILPDGPAPSIRIDAPTSGTSGNEIRFVLAAASENVSDETMYTFEIDWNNDGRIDRRVRGPLGMEIDRLFYRPGQYTMNVALVDRHGQRSVASHQLRVDP